MRIGAAICGVIGGLLLTAAAPGGVSVVAQSQTVIASNSIPTSGFFDVLLNITGSGNPQLQLWQAQVLLDTSPGQPTGLSFGTPSVTDLFPSVRSMALLTDSGFTTPNGVEINSASAASATQNIASFVPLDGENGFGLMRVPFTLAPGAVGTFHLGLDPDINTGTLLADNNSNLIPTTLVDGTIVSSIPEPACLTLVLLGSLCFLMPRRKRVAAY